MKLPKCDITGWYGEDIHWAVTHVCLWFGDVLPLAHVSASIVLLVVCNTTVTVDVRIVYKFFGFMVKGLVFSFS